MRVSLDFESDWSVTVSWPHGWRSRLGRLLFDASRRCGARFKLNFVRAKATPYEMVDALTAVALTNPAPSEGADG